MMQGLCLRHTMHSSCNTALQLHMHHSIDLVMIGLLYMAYPNGCQHTIFIPAEAKAVPYQGASLLVYCIPSLVSNQRLVQVNVTLRAAALGGSLYDH